MSNHIRMIWQGVTRLAAFLACFMLAATTASAADFQVHRGEDLNVLVVTEEILPGDDEAFLVALTQATANGEGALVVLASPGGALGAGMHIGLMIAEAGVPTFVPENEVCASACALAWLAGAPRMMTTASEIGFHQPYDERDGVMVPSIEANAVVGHYIATIGEGPEIVSFAVSAPPDEMAWLDVGTARTIGLEAVEVAASGIAVAGTPGVDRRVAPTDETAVAVASVPLPIMRQLTVQEVAALEVTGAVDGVVEEGFVTAFTSTDDDTLRGTVAAPFGVHDLATPEDELVGYEALEDTLAPVRYDVTEESSANVELAVLDALRQYGYAGNEGLREASASCWRELRHAPSLRTLQYCHVFDLVSETMVDPAAPGDFAHFAVEARLREHGDLITAADRSIDDQAAEWRNEATMVVSMMSAQ